MSIEIKPKLIGNGASSWNELIIRCDTGCDEFLVFTPHPIDTEEYIELSIVARFEPLNFWNFIKGVWRIFRYGYWDRAGVDLSRHSLEHIRDWCEQALEKTEPPE